jgi:hypothetical protein
MPRLDRQVVERGAERTEIGLKALMIQVAPVGPVELEVRGEVGVDRSLVLACDLQLADADEPAHKCVSARACNHMPILPDSRG